PNRLKRPVRGCSGRGRYAARLLLSRNCGAAIDPGTQQADLTHAEARSLGRHGLHLVVAAADGENDSAGAAFARHKGRAGIAAAMGRADAIEPQTGALLL